MSILSTFMQECINQCLRPEALLRLEQDAPKLIPEKLPSLDTLYQEAGQRFPKLINLYITLAGADAAEDVSELSRDIMRAFEYIPANSYILFTRPWINLYQAGISLSWWLFGIGEPLHRKPIFSAVTDQADKKEYVHSIMAAQNWTRTEAGWFLHNAAGGRVGSVLTKIMTALPPQKLLPSLPDPNSTCKRLISALKRLELPSDSEQWLVNVAELLANSPWRVPSILFATFDELYDHETCPEAVRARLGHLSFAIQRILELHGERDGLILYLRLMNQEAQSLGYTDLCDMVIKTPYLTQGVPSIRVAVA